MPCSLRPRAGRTPSRRQKASQGFQCSAPEPKRATRFNDSGKDCRRKRLQPLKLTTSSAGASASDWGSISSALFSASIILSDLLFRPSESGRWLSLVHRVSSTLLRAAIVPMDFGSV
eukprot:1480574-Prymnesium_polylepis.1